MKCIAGQPLLALHVNEIKFWEPALPERDFTLEHFRDAMSIGARESATFGRKKARLGFRLQKPLVEMQYRLLNSFSGWFEKQLINKFPNLRQIDISRCAHANLPVVKRNNGGQIPNDLLSKHPEVLAGCYTAYSLEPSTSLQQSVLNLFAHDLTSTSNLQLSVGSLSNAASPVQIKDSLVHLTRLNLGLKTIPQQTHPRSRFLRSNFFFRDQSSSLQPVLDCIPNIEQLHITTQQRLEISEYIGAPWMAPDLHWADFRWPKLKDFLLEGCKISGPDMCQFLEHHESLESVGLEIIDLSERTIGAWRQLFDTLRSLQLESINLSTHPDPIRKNDCPRISCPWHRLQDLRWRTHDCQTQDMLSQIPPEPPQLKEYLLNQGPWTDKLTERVKWDYEELWEDETDSDDLHYGATPFSDFPRGVPYDDFDMDRIDYELPAYLDPSL